MTTATAVAPPMRLQAALTACLALLAGCSGGPSGDPTSPTASQTSAESSTTSGGASFHLSSSSFNEGQLIPRKHTCDGAEVSPPLTFLRVPAGTKSLALTVKDPDVPTPDTPARTLNHWVVWNVTLALRASSATFPEGAVPAGAQEGANDFGHGWLGPCPPPGSPPHRYNFTAYALDVKPPLRQNATADELDAAMVGHILARSTLIGYYERAVVSTSATNSTTPAP